MNEFVRKIEQDKSFFEEVKNLAEKTGTKREIHELINLEDLIHGINLERDAKKEKKFELLTKHLLKNPNMDEDDFSYLFSILQSRYEMSVCTYREKVKSLINDICAAAIKRGFDDVCVMIYARHPGIRNVKAIRELMAFN